MSDIALFSLGEEHKMIRDAARDFAQQEIVPIAAQFDESGEFPYETIRKMGEMGFMGIEIPEEYGGAGMDTLSYVLALEEICKADASHGVIMSVNNSLYGHGILKYGTEEQKQKFVTPIASGKAIGAYSLTEPQSGSDAGSMKSRATRDCDLYDDRPGEEAERRKRVSRRGEYARPDAWKERTQAWHSRLCDE